MNVTRTHWISVLFMVITLFGENYRSLLSMEKYHYLKNINLEGDSLNHGQYAEISRSQLAEQRLTYSRDKLLTIRSAVSNNTSMTLDHSVCSLINKLKINRRKRGKKAGLRSNIQRETPIIANHSNLIHIKITNYSDERVNPCVRLMVYNTRSAMAKPLDINELISSNNAEITSICETWIKPGDDARVKEMCPKNFSFHGKSRDTRGGGVGIVVHENICIKHENDHGHFNSFEYHSVVLYLVERRVKLVTVYRPPTAGSMKGFLEEFEMFLGEVTMFSGSILVVGDFNIHFNKPEQTDVNRFVDILDSFDMHQHVQEATHKFGNTIDLVITRTEDDIIKSVSVLPRLEIISDHHPIVCTLHAATPQAHTKTVTKRPFRNLDKETFADDIAKRLNSSLQFNDEMDVDWLETNLHSCTKDALDVHAPLTKKVVKAHKQHPWYNDSIHSQRQIRRRLERKWRKTKAATDWQAYETQCQLVVQTIRQAKQAYYKEKLIASPSDAYQVVNSLLQVNNTQLPSCATDADLADRFVNFFMDKVTKIRSFLDSCATDDQDGEVSVCPHKLTSFVPITQDDLRKLIFRAKTKSCKIDPMPTHILKESAVLDALLPYLTTMVNASLRSGVMPDGMKTALVIPHLKKQGLDPDTLSNYRPVSNIQFLGKIIEKCVARQLCQHLTAHGLGDKLQSAYKAGHSTETALVKVKRDCDHALDSGKAVLLIMLDLSAAFDTIDHSILLDRLQRLVGVEGIALKWLKSYVSGRTQKVIINNSVSTPVPLEVGVPQGSVLGPLLFLLYILPLQHLIKKHGVSYHGYADDTQLYLDFDPKAADGLSNAMETLEMCISDIKKWMVTSKLKLNDDKTEFAIFASPYYHKKIMDLNPAIKIGNAFIKPSKTVRNLGVFMDSSLTMSNQLKAVSRSMYYHMRGIRHIRHYLDDDACTKAVITLVISRLDYANALLAGTSETGLRKLQMAQNCAARLITGTPRTEHITPVLHKLHWLPVKQRIAFKSICIVYKSVNVPSTPSYIADMFNRYVTERSLRSSTSNQLAIQRSKNKYGDRRFNTWASKLWNSLPSHVQEAPSFSSFKRALKTLLFLQYYQS